MKQKATFILILLLLLPSAILLFAKETQAGNTDFVSYTADAKTQQIQLYWKDDKHENFGSIQNLKSWVESKNKTLVFAMNGGMYKTDGAPLGLFIENTKQQAAINRRTGSGNFYLQPNGVFYITTGNTAAVCKTQNFKNKGNIKYATQSGPMLVIDGQINTVFTKSSANVNIRNGVGILPSGKVVFAMSKKEINFYDFASYFKTLGCKNALYLDGFVSRTYLPEKNWTQTDGNFGVIIGVTN